MNRRRFVLLGAAALAACGKKKIAVAPPPPPPASPAPATSPVIPAIPVPSPATPPVGNVERGLASWYGHPYHGRQAADGEIYDMETLVAAHRTLPFQTRVRVRNVNNGKTVNVRIIDRGPFVDGRVIDLSHAAAQAIDLIGPGVAPVEVTIIGVPADPEPALFGVQVGAFRVQSNATRMEANMTAVYGFAKTVLRPGDPPVWRVLAGRENSEDGAEVLARRIRDEQNVPEAFVVRLDP